jgi:hypothetical protein
VQNILTTIARDDVQTRIDNRIIDRFSEANQWRKYKLVSASSHSRINVLRAVANGLSCMQDQVAREIFLGDD